jgi:hypothetical protein
MIYDIMFLTILLTHRDVGLPRQCHLQRVGGPIFSKDTYPAFINVLKYVINILSSSREVGNLSADRMKLQQSRVRQRQLGWIGGCKCDDVWYVISSAYLCVICRSYYLVSMRLFLYNALVYT